MSLNKLNKIQFWNRLHLYAILLALIIFSLSYKIGIIIVILYLLFLHKREILSKELIYFLLISLLFNIIRINHFSSFKEGNINENLIVYDIKEKNDYFNITFKYKNEKIIYTVSNFDYDVGDYLNVSGTLALPKEKRFKNDFDYQMYLKSKHISYVLKNPTFTYLGSRFCLNKYRYKLKSIIDDSYSDIEASYLNNLVLGIHDDELNNSYDNLNLNYLFSVSGAYGLCFYLILFKILFNISKNYEKSENIALGVTWVYGILIIMPTSFFKMLLFLTLKLINERRNLKFTNLDLLSICFMTFLVINPYYLFNLGFIFTYLITFFYLVYDIKDKKGILDFKRGIYTSLVGFPLIINQTGFFNALSLLLAPIIFYLFKIIIYPICLFSVLFRKVDLTSFFSFINKINAFFNSKALSIHFPKFSLLTTIIYYILLVIILIRKMNNKKYNFNIITFILFLLICKFNIIFAPYGEVTFLDVGQADSIYIHNKCYKEIVLIDTVKENEEYLKAKGIDSINTIFITHSDDDHFNNIITLCEKYKVRRIVLSYYDEDIKKLNLEQYADEVKYARAGDNIKALGIEFMILTPFKASDVKNEISMSIYAKIGGLKYLFAADITIKEENEIMNNYQNLEIDVLKVAHHGSKTSSSAKFINFLKPKYAIISVGENNIYKLPNEEVINNLKESKVYLTSINKNISFYFYNSKCFIKCFKKT